MDGTTGDAYMRDADGYFHYHARTDDMMIISAGYNIASPEIEDALMLHPAVAECGVISQRPDEERGQIVKPLSSEARPADEAMVKTLRILFQKTVAPPNIRLGGGLHREAARTQTSCSGLNCTIFTNPIGNAGDTNLRTHFIGTRRQTIHPAFTL